MASDSDRHEPTGSARTAAIALAVAGLVATLIAMAASAWSLVPVLSVLWPTAALAVAGGIGRLLDIAALPVQTFPDEHAA
jgi:hypothetical protein